MERVALRELAVGEGVSREFSSKQFSQQVGYAAHGAPYHTNPERVPAGFGP